MSTKKRNTQTTAPDSAPDFDGLLVAIGEAAQWLSEEHARFDALTVRGPDKETRNLAVELRDAAHERMTDLFSAAASVPATGLAGASVQSRALAFLADIEEDDDAKKRCESLTYSISHVVDMGAGVNTEAFAGDYCLPGRQDPFHRLVGGATEEEAA